MSGDGGSPLVLTERRDQVGIATLNRPEVHNALNRALMDQLADALEAFDADPEIRVLLLTGNDRAFAAGADIAEMAQADPLEMARRNQFAVWDRIRRIGKPLIAAVSGFALGGGCELAMACDLIVASETARFGQPETTIGVMPGAGGTQRLTRAVGKAVAMEVILGGRFLTAQEALARGLVNRVLPVEVYYAEALALAKRLAQRAPVALRLAKQSVLRSFELPLSEALELERKDFYLLFATQDQREGMAAFLEKRAPHFTGH